MSVDDDKPRGRWPKLWAAWAALAIGSFFAIEIPALVNDSGGDTLTEQVQYLGGFWPWGLVVAVTGFAGWFVVHFVGRDSRIWKWSKKKNGTNSSPELKENEE